MLVREILESKNIEPSVDEGWKRSAANLGAAAAVSLAGAGTASLGDKLSQWVRGHSEKTTPAQIKAAGGGKQAAPKIEPITNSPLEKKLMDYAARAGLEGEELAQFLAQCAHETMDFRRMVESGSPSYFKKYERSYAPNQARILGNIHRGDGTRFKGRGYIQLTGRYNYARAERDLGLPLLDDPELAADPDHAARIAVWYWNKRVKPRVTDFTDTREVTEKINPGLKGLEDRHDNFIKYMESGD